MFRCVSAIRLRLFSILTRLSFSLSLSICLSLSLAPILGRCAALALILSVCLFMQWASRAAKVVNLRLYCCIAWNEEEKRWNFHESYVCFAKRTYSSSSCSKLLDDLMRLSTQCEHVEHTYTLLLTLYLSRPLFGVKLVSWGRRSLLRFLSLLLRP